MGLRMILGVDVGARRVALSCPQKQESVFLDLKAKGPRRSHELRLMRHFVRSHTTREMHLVLERPFVSGGAARNPTSTIGLSEAAAMILSARLWDQEPIFVSPPSWKKHVVGNYRADKEEIREWFQEHHPDLYEEHLTEDQVDAYCIALYGQMIASGEVEPPTKKRRKRATAKSKHR